MIYRYLNISELDIEKLKPHVSKERIEKSEKYKHDIDKLRSVAVEYLLNETLKEYDESIETPVVLSYDEQGKPHLYLQNKEVFISLTHSGDYVGCMVSDRPCGIDIEKHKDREYEKIARRICTDLEIYGIETAKKFFDLWTAKESILKAYGSGLALDMRSFEIRKNGEEFSTLVDGKEYMGAIKKFEEGYSLSYAEEVI